MERAEWLKRMRSMAEGLYDQISPKYWVTYGFYENETHLAYLRKFLERIARGSCAAQTCAILSAGCGAGRYDGFLLEAGHSVVGIDQSTGMLARAREHFPIESFPRVRYEKMGLQEIGFREAFDGVICIDALEHVCPEDYPRILRKFKEALKPGGMLYFTVDDSPAEELETAYQRAKALGLPVVYGELVDEVDTAYEQIKSGSSDASSDRAVYHFYPAFEQVREWLAQAGLTIEEEGSGSGYHHFLAKKQE